MQLFPTEMRHSPPKFLGLRLLDFKLDQEIAKLDVILTHSPANTTTVLFLRSNLEQAQLEVGIGAPFYNLPANEFQG